MIRRYCDYIRTKFSEGDIVRWDGMECIVKIVWVYVRFKSGHVCWLNLGTRKDGSKFELLNRVGYDLAHKAQVFEFVAEEELTLVSKGGWDSEGL